MRSAPFQPAEHLSETLGIGDAQLATLPTRDGVRRDPQRAGKGHLAQAESSAALFQIEARRLLVSLRHRLKVYTRAYRCDGQGLATSQPVETELPHLGWTAVGRSRRAVIHRA